MASLNRARAIAQERDDRALYHGQTGAERQSKLYPGIAGEQSKDKAYANDNDLGGEVPRPRNST
jgi:hypothetical protein